LIQYPQLSEGDLEDLIPAKCTLNCVKFESVRNVSTYYVVNDDPILFVNEGRLYPSGNSTHTGNKNHLYIVIG